LPPIEQNVYLDPILTTQQERNCLYQARVSIQSAQTLNVKYIVLIREEAFYNFDVSLVLAPTKESLPSKFILDSHLRENGEDVLAGCSELCNDLDAAWKEYNIHKNAIILFTPDSGNVWITIMRVCRLPWV
jgi:hypothetical protein